VKWADLDSSFRGASIVTCREFADFISDYLSGELAPDVRTHFDDHLERCANCRRYLTSYDESVKLGTHAYDDDCAELPADVPEDLVRAILVARRSS
jgi:anti-sigma factor RsiW